MHYCLKLIQLYNILVTPKAIR